MSEDSLEKLFHSAIKELQEANLELNKAASELEFARKTHTDAVNRVNAAQREIGKLYEALQDEAPRESDWQRVKIPGIRVS